jgi:hypothetical protein
MSARLAVIVSVAVLGGCARDATPPMVDAGVDAVADVDSTCDPLDADRGACVQPLDTELCAATWDDRPAPMCGLRIYDGPGAGYLLQYISYSDVPPVGGPTWMCIYDASSHQLVGAWALDHYPRWCCGYSLDLFEGVASDDIANMAASMATHPACPDAGT